MGGQRHFALQKLEAVDVAYGSFSTNSGPSSDVRYSPESDLKGGH